MDNSKHEQLKIAKKMWELYQNGMDKKAIAKELNINRAEVIHVIKYTTLTLYLSNVEFQNYLQSCVNEKEELSEKLNFWKFSDLDAYSNNEKTGNKLTYKRLVKIRESKIDELNKTLLENKSKYLNLKKWYWIILSIAILFSLSTGYFIKGYIMKKQNYRQIDMSSVWENQEDDALYRLLKKN